MLDSSASMFYYGLKNVGNYYFSSENPWDLLIKKFTLFIEKLKNNKDLKENSNVSVITYNSTSLIEF